MRRSILVGSVVVFLCAHVQAAPVGPNRRAPRPLQAEPPVLSPIADQWIVVGVKWAYTAQATGNPAPTYSLGSAPAGMSINSVTGLITYTATVEQVGGRGVTVRATNSVGSDSTSFNISVSTAPLAAPMLDPIGNQTVTAGQTWTCAVHASGVPSPDYSLAAAPSGMSIEYAQGGRVQLVWRPAETSPGGSYPVTVVATNRAGSDSESFTITVKPLTHILSVSAGPGGSVTRPGEGTFEYAHGQAVAIEATPAPGYRFTSWTGSASVWSVTSPSTTVSVTEDCSVRANFAVDTGVLYSLDISASNGGSIATPGQGTFQYPKGTSVSVTAVPNGGCRFVNWTGSAVDAGKVANPASPNITITMDASYSLRANFEADTLATYSLTVWATGGGQIVSPPTGSLQCAAGAVISVSARPDPGYYFVNWTGSAVDAGDVGSPTSANTSVTMHANYTLVAHFAVGGQARLTISSSPGGRVVTPGEGTFYYTPGTGVSVTALVLTGYQFSGWTGSAVSAGKVGNPASLSTSVTVDGDYSLVANFEATAPTVRYSLSISTMGGGRVVTPGFGLFTYPSVTAVSVSAQANSGYEFIEWRGSAVSAGKVGSPASASTTVTVDGDYTLEAYFGWVGEPVRHTLTLTAKPGGHIISPGVGSFQFMEGSSVPITAEPISGYRFAGWTGGAVDAGKVGSPTSASTTVTMSADYALTANFEPVGGGGTGGTGGSGGTEGTGGTGGTGGIGGGPGQVSSLRLLTPNGGESLLSGSTCSVQWQAEGAAGNVRIELSVDGAATWTPVASSATGGHYAWLVPSVDSDRCIIRIVATNGAGMDASNAPFSIHTHAGRMWYVDAAAKGSGDGVTWANALVCLQDAIVKAAPGDSIWVAEGLYWPDLGRGWTAGDRAATFQLKNGVAIYGGFPRGGDWSQRNPLRHQSILSGDIGAIGAAEDNSFHVVSVRGTDQTGVLDGGVITGGCASGSEESQDRGAGLYCFEGYAQVRNCILVGNTAAAQGGGACIVASRVTFINCVFNGNSANDGGALYNDQGTAALINCTVVANQGFWRAGLACPTSVINSILWGNPGRLNRTSYDDLAQISGTLRPAVNFCCVEGWQDSLGGKGNFGRNPLFADAAGPDHILGTPDDDLRLQAGSPCIDQGDNTALGVEIKTDLAGQPRIVNGVIDIGAQESGGPAVGP